MLGDCDWSLLSLLASVLLLGVALAFDRRCGVVGVGVGVCAGWSWLGCECLCEEVELVGVLGWLAAARDGVKLKLGMKG